MIGKIHLNHILHCLRSKAAKDMKANAQHAPAALRRIKLGRECEKMLTEISQQEAMEVIQMAQFLGWQPPVYTTENLNDLAFEWLDRRFNDMEARDETA